MAIRDKVIVRLKGSSKPIVFEVKRPGGTVGFRWDQDNVVRVQEQTRTDRVLRAAAYSGSDVKSVEFEPGN